MVETIVTERLVLRPFRFGDVDDVFAYARGPEWSRQLRFLPRPYERRHAEQFIARQVLLDRATHPTWALTLEGTVIDAAFVAHGDLNRVQARADARNVGSQRVMEKVGMVKEGVLRLSRVERGEAFDEAWYAILRREGQETRGGSG